jgi:succinate dehydrogenase / fumarate reductase cytochrome b subunit
MVARNTDGKLISRPMSPHLQIYRWPLSMALSILHRASGIALSVGTLLLTWWLVAAATSPQAFAQVQGFIASPIGMLLLFGWSVALIFHLFTGIRHLAWDMGYGFEPGEYNASGRLVVIATAVGVVLVWAIGLTVWRG